LSIGPQVGLTACNAFVKIAKSVRKPSSAREGMSVFPLVHPYNGLSAHLSVHPSVTTL